MVQGLRILLAVCVLSLASSATIKAQAVDYHNTIKPLLEANCNSCHSKGNIGPMPLTSYKEVSAYARMIEQVTANGRMPPYKGDNSGLPVKDVHALTETELANIKKWVAAGLPMGIEKKVGSKNNGNILHLDRADKTFAMQQRYSTDTNHTAFAQIFVIPTNLDEDILIDALEFVPGNKRIIKSCAIAIDTTEQSAELDLTDIKYGYANFGAFAFIPAQFMWHYWIPGQGARYLDKGFVKRIPARSKLLFYVSYMPSLTKEIFTDSSYLKVHLANKGVKKTIVDSRVLIDTNSISNHPFIIKKNTTKEYVATITLAKPTTIHSIMPMGQYVCKSWIIEVDDPKKGKSVLLSIKDWDFNWRRKYELETPINLSAGTQIRATAVYDNTEENKNLPILPPQNSKYGEARRQEMFTVAFDVSE